MVLPYMYPDLNVARDLANAGAAAIMPLGAPIGSNKGLGHPGLHSDPHRRDGPARHCGRGHRPPLPGLRGHGDGGRRHHGQHRPGHCRGPAPDGRRLPPGHRGRPEGLPLRPGPGAGPGAAASDPLTGFLHD